MKLPPLDGPLATFKEFSQMQRESYSHDDIQRYYDRYKSEHIAK